ncbi:transposase, partial [Sulfitobacter sp. TSTF-M16]|nr:transposase [Sulfitobacter aestuariivivens]
GELDRADEVFEQTGTVLPEGRMERTLRKLEHLQKEAARYRSIEKRMDETGETQVSLSDPDARSMATTPRMPRVVGCNVQTAVEAENHLIVAHEVTMHGYDRDALSMMAIAARDAMALDQIAAIADKGYYKSEEILACEEASISVVVPKPQTSNAGARGQFDKADFAYDAEADVYVCPAGQRLIYRFTGQQDNKAIRTYWSSHCEGCVLKDKCTNSKERRIRRWEHEDVLERVQQRL